MPWLEQDGMRRKASWEVPKQFEHGQAFDVCYVSYDDFSLDLKLLDVCLGTRSFSCS